MTMSLRLVLFALFVLAVPFAHATAWVERHDLTASGLQSELNRWTNAPFNLRPVSVTGYEENSQALYAVIFEKASGAAWTSASGLTAAQLTAQSTTKAGQSYWPVFVHGFTVGGTPYFNVIWENHRYGVGSVEVQPGLTRAGLSGAILSRVSQGFTLAYLSTYTQGSVDMYVAIWSKNVSSSSVQCGFGLSASAYQSQFNNMAGQGFRLAAQTISLEGTEERYCCVWKKPAGTGWWAYGGLSEVNFQAETLNAYYTGYRPVYVAVHTQNGQSRFSAVWSYNGGLTPGQAAPIFDAINTYMSTNDVPGLSLSVSRNGRLVFSRGFGQADVAHDTWVHPNHRFRIASISKPLTATAMMRLRDDGLLTSNTNRVFGTGAILGTTYGTQAYSANERALNITHLLSHTTGWTNDGQLWNNGYGTDHKAIIGWQLDNANQKAPGTAYQYMNTDYCVAGRVIERLSGTNYENYVKKEVLAPCGITDMELGNATLAGRKLNEVVYYASPGAADPYVVIDPHRMDANGGWIAKPSDLLLFMRRMDGRTNNTDIVTGARLNEMLTIPAPGTMSYGLGLFYVNTPGVGNGWGHNGCMAGTRSFLIHRLDGLDFAVTLNIDVPSDGCTWNLRAGIDAALSAIPASAWPDYDLFSSVNPDYDTWAVQNLPYYARFQPGLKEDFWGPEADYDGDGMPNLMEAYFSTDPTVADVSRFNSLVEDGDFVVRWTLPIFASQNGVILSSEYKSNVDAASWNSGPTVQLGPWWGSYETRTPVDQRPRIFQRFKAIAP